MTLQWGIIGAGSIAHAFATALDQTDSGALAGVASRDGRKAREFASKYGDVASYGSYQALLDAPDIDVVYIATPHPQHPEWAIKAARAGKHILCEKPVALNHASAMAMIEEARANDVFFMEAFMYRCHPQTGKIVELIRDGAIGDVKLIKAAFGYRAGINPEGRLFANALGGGGIMDVGCYPVSMARLIAGAAVGTAFEDPVGLSAQGVIGETGVDEVATAELQFDSGILAQLATSIRVNQINTVTIFGEEGYVHVPSPWKPTGNEPGSSVIQLHRPGSAAEEIVIGSSGWLYAIEADHVAAHIDDREAPAMSLADTLGNLKTLDQWRDAIGLQFDEEHVDAGRGPIYGAPISLPSDGEIPHRSLPGLDKPISHLVMGCDNQLTMPQATVMFDDFVQRGGNCFDTAHIYTGGTTQKLLGQWMQDRGNREDLVVIGKGAHTPQCVPEAIAPQMEEDLDRLQTDYVDLYFMHRDDVDVPIGEFVDAILEQYEKGRIRLFGGSNWTISRTEAGNEYARSKGVDGFTILSNNFSLARMINPVWGGTMAASDDETRSWLEKTNTALFPWSSQARGFFTDRAGPDKLDNRELANAWYSDDNFERRRRAYELAEARSVDPMAICLAYVLGQNFPVFPLIGPRTISETVSSLAGLRIDLSEDEIKWLDLRD